MERLVISMDGGQLERLRKLARAQGISVAALVRKAVDRILDDKSEERFEQLERRVEALEKKK